MAGSGATSFTQLKLWLPATKRIVAPDVYLKVNHKLEAQVKHRRWEWLEGCCIITIYPISYGLCFLNNELGSGLTKNKTKPFVSECNRSLMSCISTVPWAGGFKGFLMRARVCLYLLHRIFPQSPASVSNGCSRKFIQAPLFTHILGSGRLSLIRKESQKN